MKILGIDYGEAKIGLAISEGEIAQPLGVIKIDSGNPEDSRNRIRQICGKENIDKILVGISEGKMAEKTKKFGRQIKEITGLPVEFLEEDLTSKEARRKMIEAGKAKRRRKIDEHAVAAALILERYLNNKNLTNY